ncbi:MAG: hypothetical protein U5K81_13895 [Trueperaceae bacterium]|nr:hypothetical protein [Trueperaceae bacterium]
MPHRWKDVRGETVQSQGLSERRIQQYKKDALARVRAHRLAEIRRR